MKKLENVNTQGDHDTKDVKLLFQRLHCHKIILLHASVLVKTRKRGTKREEDGGEEEDEGGRRKSVSEEGEGGRVKKLPPKTHHH